MARWRQDRITGKLVPIDEAAVKRDAGHGIHGIFEPFKSMVDGTIISTNKQLREHNKRNNVVNADEFTPEFYAEKAKERADFYQGKHSRQESLKRKQEIYENMIRAEREHGQ
jgi:hypothetical protein